MTKCKAISRINLVNDMRIRFKLPLLMICILIASSSLVFASYYFLYHKSYAMTVVADYPLSINYNSSQVIDENNYEDVVFSVINSGDEDLLYTISFIGVFSSEDINYTLVGDENTYTGVFNTKDVTSTILIKAGDKQNYTLTLDYEGESKFSGELYVTKELTEEMNFSQTILSNNASILDEALTTVGSAISTDDEGLIKLVNEEEIYYYFRGNVDNNYVNFADYTWRIVNISSDGLVKLVLDSELDVLTTYYESKESYTFNESSVYEYLETWYDDNLIYYDKYIKEANYCSDDSLVNSENNTYAAYNRVVSSLGATYSCISEYFTSKIALLTIDEVIYAGASYSEENSSFYLINDNIENTFFTMTSATLLNSTFYPFTVSSDGEILYTESGLLNRALRPVIVINKNVYVSGIGTKDDPYIIESID